MIQILDKTTKFFCFYIYTALILFTPYEGNASSPANDNFTNAFQIAGLTGQEIGTNEYATTEPGEPNHANVYDQTETASVWFRWQPPIQTTVVFDTHGSDFDTVIAVYTGSSLVSLTEIAGSDDDGKTHYRTGGVKFNPTEGEIYYIAVGGFFAAEGHFTLNWSSPAPPEYSPDTWESDDTFTEANTIILNNKFGQTHQFHSPGDQDWMKFYGIAEKPYGVYVSSEGSAVDLIIELFDTDGTSLLNSANDYPAGGGTGDHDEELHWNCPEDGIYYLRIRDFYGNTSGENTVYRISVDGSFQSDAGEIYGTVMNRLNQPVWQARILTTGSSGGDLSRENTGEYTLLKHDPGTYTLYAELKGYLPYKKNFTLSSLESKRMDIVMSSEDINCDGDINLQDAVFALSLLAGRDNSGQNICLQNTLNLENISIADAVLTLQVIAGFK